MAKRQITASTNGLLLIDPAGGTDWSLPICLTDTALNGTTATNNSSTFCGDISQPGDKSSTINITGAQFLDPETDEVDFGSLFTLWNDQTIFSWRLGPLNPVANDIVKTGLGYFSSWSETNNNSGATWGGTIQTTGGITQTYHGAS
jgi:hypothetical protein